MASTPAAQTWKQERFGLIDLMYPGYQDEALLTSTTPLIRGQLVVLYLIYLSISQQRRELWST